MVAFDDQRAGDLARDSTLPARPDVDQAGAPVEFARRFEWIETTQP